MCFALVCKAFRLQPAHREAVSTFNQDRSSRVALAGIIVSRDCVDNTLEVGWVHVVALKSRTYI